MPIWSVRSCHRSNLLSHRSFLPVTFQMLTWIVPERENRSRASSGDSKTRSSVSSHRWPPGRATSLPSSLLNLIVRRSLPFFGNASCTPFMSRTMRPSGKFGQSSANAHCVANAETRKTNNITPRRTTISRQHVGSFTIVYSSTPGCAVIIYSVRQRFSSRRNIASEVMVKDRKTPSSLDDANLQGNECTMSACGPSATSGDGRFCTAVEGRADTRERPNQAPDFEVPPGTHNLNAATRRCDPRR